MFDGSPACVVDEGGRVSRLRVRVEELMVEFGDSLLLLRVVRWLAQLGWRIRMWRLMGRFRRLYR